MNSIIQFKYKKPSKIHYSNFNIFTEDEFFCLDGCMKTHARGLQKINLTCLEYFLKHKPHDITISYTGCLEELIEYIIYSGIMDSFVESSISNKKHTENTVDTMTNSEDDLSLSDMGGNWENDVSKSERTTDSDEGYYSSSPKSDDYFVDEQNCYIVNENNFEWVANNKNIGNVSMPRFLTDNNITTRQAILDSILAEDQIDYLDCGMCDNVYDAQFIDNDICNWRMCYFHNLNLNSLYIIKLLRREELINNYKIKFLNK